MLNVFLRLPIDLTLLGFAMCRFRNAVHNWAHPYLFYPPRRLRLVISLTRN
jgi:hypothetical protein